MIEWLISFKFFSWFIHWDILRYLIHWNEWHWFMLGSVLLVAEIVFIMVGTCGSGDCRGDEIDFTDSSFCSRINLYCDHSCFKITHCSASLIKCDKI